MDLIDRQAAIDAFNIQSDDDGWWTGTVEDFEIFINGLPSAQRWIPVKTRPMTDEERKETSELWGYDIEYEYAVVFTGEMPEDGQEVWVCSKCGNVWQDTCVVDEGIYLEENGDWLDIVAWMPYERPEPWKGDSND